jgi:glycyl-tRNA synthetase beta chain
VGTQSLVVELLTEELPPKALARLGDAFADSLYAGLSSRGLLTPASAKTSFATPRRLAVKVSHVLGVAADAEVVDKLMPAKVARDATGQVSQALAKKLAGLGRAHLATATLDAVDGPDRIYVASDGKADYVYLRSLAKGLALERALSEALETAITDLPIPKVMTYQLASGETVKFVRPAHRLLALYGGDVIAVRALGLDAGRVTAGHRFLSRPDLSIADAEAYEETLAAEGKVIARFDERRARIVKLLLDASQGAIVAMPDALLDEVTALVEQPAVYKGTFDPAFLTVPQECLILTMQQNQKYFALADASGKLLPRFLLVSNLPTDEPVAIVSGNERVLRARLADARFFFDQDRKVRLADRLPKLASIVYHNKLGTQADRVARIRALAADIARAIGADVAATERAATLAKTDLVTDMVGEFPELQGLMGRYYAQHDGEASDVAAAIEQHYWPRFAGDALPQKPVAQAVALADKLETLAGMFGIGALPSGDRDPFGLRRQAIGAIRILVERRLALPLRHLLDAAFAQFSHVPGVVARTDELAEFIKERLRGYLRESGASANQVEAVLSRGLSQMDTVAEQLDAVKAFAALPEADSLAAANKRIVNILRKAEGGERIGAAVDHGLLSAGAETDLYAKFEELRPVVSAHAAKGEFTHALLALASARPVVDRFFDDVMVMADDPAVRANRLALLSQVAETMNRVADISKLAA